MLKIIRNTQRRGKLRRIGSAKYPTR